jgi:hypothetical protein
MTQVIVGEMLRSKLHHFCQSLDWCNESGQVLTRVLQAIGSSRYEGRSVAQDAYGPVLRFHPREAIAVK